MFKMFFFKNLAGPKIVIFPVMQAMNTQSADYDPLSLIATASKNEIIFILLYFWIRPFSFKNLLETHF